MRLSYLCTSIPFLFAPFALAAVPQSPFITSLIASAEAKIKASPKAASGYSDLAFALLRRARETADPALWNRADIAIDTALKLEPGNFEARKTRVIERIQQSRFADAEEEGKVLNKQIPDDNLMYGLLADAALAQGRYPEAEALIQRMLDLRQINGPGLERAARLREAIGFPDGASEFWNSAFRLASTSDVEERAHCLTQLAGLCRRRAKLADASRYAADALGLEPDYPDALLEQARIAMDSKKPDVALSAIQTRLAQRSDDVVAQYLLTLALEALGKTAEAGAAGERYLSSARANTGQPFDTLRIRYLAGHGQAGEAVRFAKSRESSGGDLEFYDAYALALLAAGDIAGAKAKMNVVLAPGILRPEFFLDAARIAKKNGQVAEARSYFKKCIEAGASSEFADVAIQELQNTAEPHRK